MRPRRTSPRRDIASWIIVAATCVVASPSVSSSQSVSFASRSCSSGNAAVPLPSSPATPVSTGLRNCGNTCYLASQMQCAFHIPRVRSLILQDPSKDLMATPATPSAARQSLKVLFGDMLKASTTTEALEEASGGALFTAASPQGLCRVLGINVLEQQDSQEFWKLLLPALQLPDLVDLYQGAFQGYLIALDGSGREKRREETFLDLSLDVVSHSNTAVGSVDAALAALFRTPELLSAKEGNGWRPQKGDEPVDAHKGSLLVAAGLPSILQLHLKRFRYDWSSDTTSKLNHPFAFPLELDLSTFCEDAKSEGDRGGANRTLYDLQAIVVHAGDYGSGHYYSYVRPDIRSEQWFRFNDHLVERVPYADVYRDACGGRAHASSSTLDDESSLRHKNILQRLQALFAKRGPDSYGYGGRTSNAYVLQYVRRSDIPLLYEECKLPSAQAEIEPAFDVPQ